MLDKNCYSCKFRGGVLGSCHSSCNHPEVVPIIEYVKFQLGVENVLRVRGTEHGIRSGWFVWPMDFDPTWLDNCNGYTAQEKK